MFRFFWQDVRYGFRMLARRPFFSGIIILILTLGIAANTTVFSVINSVLLRSLPFKNPDGLVYVVAINQNDTHSATSYADFRDWKEQNKSFENISAFSTGSRNLTGGNEAEYVQAGTVLANFFQTLNVNPIYGRDFTNEDSQWGQHTVAILSHGLWVRLGGDPGIINKTIEIDAQEFRVVGVLPNDSDSYGPALGESKIDLWIPLSYQPNDNRLTNRRQRNLAKVIARLKPGVTIKQADQEMGTITRQLAQQYPDTNGNFRVNAVGVIDDNTAPYRLTLFLAMGAVIFVLIIACVNVTSLLLARAATRSREVAIRTALGASRQRLVVQLLTESGLLALISGLLGAILTSFALQMVVKFGPDQVPRLGQTTFDIRVLGFVLFISLLTVVLIGLVPALRTSRPNIEEALRESGKASTGSRRTHRVLQALVVSQISLTVILLIGATLMIKSYSRLLLVNPGFRADNILTFQLRLPITQYKDRLAPFFQELTDRISPLPGVKSAAIASWCAVPIVGRTNSMYSWVEGRPDPTDTSDFPMISSRQVTTDYFDSMGIPVLRGRSFTASDLQNPDVAIINQTMARSFFSNEDPIGQKIWIGVKEHRIPLTVIGVSGDVRYKGLDVPDEMAVYSLLSNTKVGNWYVVRVLIRTEREPMTLLGAARQQVMSINRNLPLSDIMTMEQGVTDSVADKRFAMSLLSLLAVVALILATTGIYGVIAHSVNQRTREIGLRMALGAQRADIYKMILQQGLVLTAIGIGLGTLGAFAMMRIMAGILYGISVNDSLTYVGAIVLLALVALAACTFPARRAIRIDPMLALRHE